MKHKIHFVWTALFIAGSGALFGQVPFIKSLSRSSAGSQETISIQGINFGTNASNIKVLFGSVSATPQSISDQLIEVKVPSGAVFENVGVLNTSTGLAGYSRDPFLLSYGGTNPFDKTQLVGQTDFASESDLYDLTLADFDGDGKSDVATANSGSNNISVFLNTSTPGTVSFTKSILTPGTITLHVSSGDLNGDGKPDLLVTEKNGARLFVYKNTSTVGAISFTMQTVTVSGGKLSQSKVVDLDMNGKMDVVITDQSSGRFIVLPGQGTLASIQFGTPTIITTSGLSTDGIAVGDFDGDSFPEIIVSEFLGQTGIISIVKNQSSPGSLSFATPVDISTAVATISNLRIGDLDGDSKPDIAATAVVSSGVVILGNQCTASAIKFADPVFFQTTPTPQTASNPWGLDFGDVDGDGKTDLIVCSITQQFISVLNNSSTSGNFNFQLQTVTTTFPNRHVRIGDVDNDGRPDLVYTSIDYQGVIASKISIFRNVNCVTPKLSPLGPITICNGFTQRLNASNNPGSTYEWFKDGISQGAPGTNPFLDVSAAGGAYTVKLVSGSCSKTSSAVQINVVSGSSLSTATPNPVTPVCVGGTLTLSVNDVSASDYVWTGPGSFTAHGLTANRPGFQPDQAGKYTLEVMVGSCVQQRATLIVDVVDIPGVEVQFSGSDIICTGQTKQYTVFPSVSNFTYQWAESTSGDVAGATNSTFTASTTGKYFIKLKSTINTSCAAISTTPKKVRIAQPPTVNFSPPSTVCTTQVINFTDQSTVDTDPEDTEVNYSWDFGDTGTAATKDATHFYTTPQTYNAKHTVSYRNQSCPSFKVLPILVQSAPPANITTPSGVFSVCPGDSLQLQISGTFDSYLWNTGKTTSSIQAKQGGDFSVDLTSGSCKITATKTVTQLSAPVVTPSADPSTIHAGGTSQLNVTGTLTSFLWRPNSANLTDSLIANPVASPKFSTTYTILGKDANGCKGSATVDLTVIPDKTLNGLIPDKFFSPNADGINDVWKVENAPVANTCGVAIYDERGLKIFEAKPYLNDWNGTSSQGKVLPAGVYYYVIKCDDSPGNYLGGSINIIR
ncbi:hypothetical protein WSM22_00010 [Cytophagales bacterium WSM2-2]|nr:hypothetical protein WSM22_00010 [Cytophagales bacterium WSM2-2]